MASKLSIAIDKIMTEGERVASRVVLAAKDDAGPPFTIAHADCILELLTSEDEAKQEVGFLAAIQARDNGWLQSAMVSLNGQQEEEDG